MAWNARDLFGGGQSAGTTSWNVRDIAPKPKLTIAGDAEQPAASYPWLSPTATFDTPLKPAQEAAFQAWKKQVAPKDSGEDYDFRGAFIAGLKPDAATGHWSDAFKKPNHPTFSDQSVYAKFRPDLAGHWDGDNYIKPEVGPDRSNLPPVGSPEGRTALSAVAQTGADIAHLAARVLPGEAKGKQAEDVSVAPSGLAGGAQGIGDYLSQFAQAGQPMEGLAGDVIRSGVAIAPAIAAPALGLPLIAAGAAEHTAERAEQAGATPGVALAAGAVSGAVNAAAMAVPILGVVKRTNAWAAVDNAVGSRIAAAVVNASTRAAKDAGKFGATSGGLAVVDNAIVAAVQASVDPKSGEFNEDLFNRLTDGVVHATTVGAITGGIIGAVTPETGTPPGRPLRPDRAGLDRQIGGRPSEPSPKPPEEAAVDHAIEVLDPESQVVARTNLEANKNKAATVPTTPVAPSPAPQVPEVAPTPPPAPEAAVTAPTAPVPAPEVASPPAPPVPAQAEVTPPVPEQVAAPVGGASPGTAGAVESDDALTALVRDSHEMESRFNAGTATDEDKFQNVSASRNGMIEAFPELKAIEEVFNRPGVTDEAKAQLSSLYDKTLDQIYKRYGLEPLTDQWMPEGAPGPVVLPNPEVVAKAFGSKQPEQPAPATPQEAHAQKVAELTKLIQTATKAGDTANVLKLRLKRAALKSQQPTAPVTPETTQPSPPAGGPEGAGAPVPQGSAAPAEEVPNGQKQTVTAGGETGSGSDVAAGYTGDGLGEAARNTEADRAAALALNERAGQFPPLLRLIRAVFSSRYESGFIGDLAETLPNQFRFLPELWKGISAGMLEHQKVGVEMAFRALEKAGGFLLADGTGAGKAQPLHSNILTPTGWIRMGDVKVGDEVIAGDGSVTVVTGVYDRGVRAISKVEFSDGAMAECCDEHLWFTQTWDERRNTARGQKGWQGKARPLSEIRDTLTHRKDRTWNHTIPMVGPVRYTPAESLPLDPYLVGVLLGDGCLQKSSVSISSADQEIIDRVHSRLPAGLSFNKVSRYDHRITRGRKLGQSRNSEFLTRLRQLGLLDKRSFVKFIPRVFAVASVPDRIALLQGLMDTDGTVDRSGSKVSFTTTSPLLADGVQALVRSLGGTCGFSKRTPRCNGKPGRLAYTLSVCLPPEIQPFALSRKAARVVGKTKYRPARHIVGIKPMGEQVVRCIRVAHESHLYVTDNFVVTHNTTQILGVAELYRANPSRPKKVLIIAPSEVLGKPWMTNPKNPVLAGSYANDALRMGVPVKLVGHQNEMESGPGGVSPHVYVTSYDRMMMGDFLSIADDDLVVIFDEAHYLKNEAGKEKNKGSARGEYGVKLGNRAFAVLAATATPGDQVHHMAPFYRAGLLEGKSVVKALEELGIRYSPARDLQIAYAVIQPNADLKKIYKGKGTEGGLTGNTQVFMAATQAGDWIEKNLAGNGRIAEVVIEKRPRALKWGKPYNDGRIMPAGGANKIPAGDFGRVAKWKKGFDVEKDFHETSDEAKGKWGDKPVKPAHIAALVPVPQLRKNLQALFNRLTAAGMMLKREIDMTGMAIDFDFQPRPGPELTVEGKTWDQVEDTILTEFYKAENGDDVEMPADLGLHNFGRLSKAIVQGHLRRAMETFKAPRVIAAIEASIAQGRQAVVFAERVNESIVNVKDKMHDPFTGETWTEKREIYRSEGTLKLIREELKKRGIKYAELHGASEDDNATEAMRRFQSGEVDVILATAQSGGTGINLDDILGNRPRDMIVFTAPYGATENVQMLGRIHRLTTRSSSRAKYLFFDTEIDKKNAALMVNKLRFLGAIVRGGVADMAMDRTFLTQLGMTEEEVEDALTNEGDTTTKAPDASIGRTSELVLQAIDPRRPDSEWKITGNTLPHKEAIKSAAWQAGGRAVWDSGLRAWTIAAKYIPKIREKLGALLADGSNDTRGMPGARTFDAFMLGIVNGDLLPGRSEAENKAIKEASMVAAEGTAEETMIRGLHEEYVRRAVLAGWPVPEKVLQLYPKTVEWAVRTRLSRAEAAQITELLDSGFGKAPPKAEPPPVPPSPVAPAPAPTGKKAARGSSPSGSLPIVTDAVLEGATTIAQANSDVASVAAVEAEQAVREDRREETGTPSAEQQTRGAERLEAAQKWIEGQSGDNVFDHVAFMGVMQEGGDVLLNLSEADDATLEKLVTKALSPTSVSLPRRGIEGGLELDLKGGKIGSVSIYLSGSKGTLASRTKAGGAPKNMPTDRTMSVRSIAGLVRLALHIPQPKTSRGLVTVTEPTQTAEPKQQTTLDALTDVWWGRETTSAHPGRLTEKIGHRVAVIPWTALVFSHRVDGNNLVENSQYPSEMQPRSDRKVSTVMQNASTPDWDEYLGMSPYTDHGMPVIDARGVVLSGNGRSASLDVMKRLYPNQWMEYQRQLRERVADDTYGLRATNGLIPPLGDGDLVVVRVLNNKTDPYEYARLANGRTSEAMGVRDVVAEDARHLKDSTLEAVSFPESDTIDKVLNKASSAQLRYEFLSGIDPNERPTYVTTVGGEEKLTGEGLTRLKGAMLAKAYPGPLGRDLVNTFTSGGSEVLVNLERAVYGTLGQMLEMRSMMNDGRLQGELDFSEDVAWTAGRLLEIKSKMGSVEEYLATQNDPTQTSMFDFRASDVRETLLYLFGANLRSSGAMRTFIGALHDVALTNAVDTQQLDVEGEQAMSAGEISALYDATLVRAATQAARAREDKPTKSRKERDLESDQQVNLLEREREKEDQGGWLGNKPARQPAQPVSNGTEPIFDSDYEREMHERVEGRMAPSQRKGAMESLRETIEGIKLSMNGIARTFRHLPNGARYAELQRQLVQLSKDLDVVADRQGTNMTAAIGHMTPEQLRVYNWKAALDDFQWSVEELGNDEVPFFGLDHDLMRKWLWHYTSLVENDPAVQKALAGRKDVYDRVREPLIGAAEALGMHAFANRFRNPNYFRHQVIDDLKVEEANRKLQMKTPEKRSLYKHRRGSALDIEMNIEEVDHRVLTLMDFDTRKLAVLTYIDGAFNVMAAAKARAKQINREHASAFWADETAEWNRTHPQDIRTPLEHMDKTLNKGIAIAYRSLQKAADNGELYDYDGQFSDLIDRITNGGVDSLDDEAKGELFSYFGHALRNAQIGDPLQAGAELGIARLMFSAMANKRKAIKGALESAGLKTVTWRQTYNEATHAPYALNDGDQFYTAYTLAEHLANKVQNDGVADLLGVKKEQIQPALVRRPSRVMLLPNEVVATLNEMYAKNPTDGWALAYKVTTAWKKAVMTLFNVATLRAVRNELSDLDVTLVNPRALTHVPLAIKEMWKAAFTNRRVTDPLTRGFLDRGGMKAGLDFQTRGEKVGSRTKIADLATVRNIIERQRSMTPGDVAKELLLWQRANDFRESILRYANFVEFHRQIEKNGGKPNWYAASDPEVIDALPDNMDKAYRMANDLVGAYDLVGETVQNARRFALPFVSWKAINLPRYVRIARNTTIDAGRAPNRGGSFGRRFGSLSVWSAWRMLLALGGMQAATILWNAIFFPDEEDQLDQETRGRMHIITGHRTADGEIPLWTRLGALEDIVQDVGLGWALGTVRDALNGKIAPVDAAGKVSQAPESLYEQGEMTEKAIVSALIGQLNPAFSAPFEAPSGLKFWPDPFKPRATGDSATRYVAKTWMLETLVDEATGGLTGTPTEPLSKKMLRAVTTVVEPDLGAYYDLEHHAERWLHNRGLAGRTTMLPADKSDSQRALWYYKTALKMDQPEAADLWLERFAEAGGKPSTVKRSFADMKPLAWMRKEDKNAYLSDLMSTPAGQKMFDRATQWWIDLDSQR